MAQHARLGSWVSGDLPRPFCWHRCIAGKRLHAAIQLQVRRRYLGKINVQRSLLLTRSGFMLAALSLVYSDGLMSVMYHIYIVPNTCLDN